MKKIKALYKKYEEIINYLIVGVLTTIVSLLAYFIATRTFLDITIPVQLQIANVIKWVAGVIFGYFTNRRFVFKSKNKHMIREGLSFAASRLATLFLDMFIMWFMVSLLKLNELIPYGEGVSVLTSMVLVTIANYVLSKLLVFRKKKGGSLASTAQDKPDEQTSDSTESDNN